MELIKSFRYSILLKCKCKLTAAGYNVQDSKLINLCIQPYTSGLVLI